MKSLLTGFYSSQWNINRLIGLTAKYLAAFSNELTEVNTL